MTLLYNFAFDTVINITHAKAFSISYVFLDTADGVASFFYGAR